MTVVRVLAALALAGVALAACGDDDADVATGDGPNGGPALAAEYLSVEVTEDGADRPLVPGTQIRLRFDDGSLSASLGCNHLGGTHRFEGDVLVVSEMMTTDMGCDPPRHDQDEWFADLLTSRPTVELDRDILTLTSGTTVVVLRDRAVEDPDRELVGTTWEVDGFLEGTGPDGTAMALASPVEPGFVELGEDGFVTGSDGCNGFGSSDDGQGGTMGLGYEADGDRITFEGSAVQTRRGCPDGEEYLERFWAVLSGTVTWSIEADRLTLLAADGRGVTYREADG